MREHRRGCIVLKNLCTWRDSNSQPTDSKLFGGIALSLFLVHYLYKVSETELKTRTKPIISINAFVFAV